jgi:hypothetical protein
MAELRAGIQEALEADEDYESGDFITDFIVVAVVQNYESGDEGIYLVDSAPPGRALPSHKAKGFLVDALDIIRESDRG